MFAFSSKHGCEGHTWLDNLVLSVTEVKTTPCIIYQNTRHATGYNYRITVNSSKFRKTGTVMYTVIIILILPT